jgi:heptosyltransferase-2
VTRPLGPRDRVLVQLPAWLGDFVQAEPVVRALLESVSAERVALAGDAHLLELLDGRFEGVRRIAHRGRGAYRAGDWAGHDVALLLTGSFRSAWTALRAGIPRRVGWSRDGRGWLLTDRMRPALERGAVPVGIGRAGRGRRVLPRPYGATCVELLGLLGLPVREPRPLLAVSPATEEAVRARLAADGPGPDAAFALANVGARPGSAKGYPAERWARALDAWAERTGDAVVLVGGPGEEAVVEEVRAGCRRASVHALVAPVVGLAELAALAARARVVLTADCGPRHLANAVGAALVVVHGPTDPRHAADHLDRQALLSVPVRCGPCHRERCPLPGEARHACMREIDPIAVAQAGARLAVE